MAKQGHFTPGISAKTIVFDPAKGKMLFRDAAAIWLESRKADTRNNAENHRYALAPAATRRGDGKTLGIDAVFVTTRSTRSPASASKSGSTVSRRRARSRRPFGTRSGPFAWSWSRP